MAHVSGDNIRMHFVQLSEIIESICKELDAVSDTCIYLDDVLEFQRFLGDRGGYRGAYRYQADSIETMRADLCRFNSVVVQKGLSYRQAAFRLSLLRQNN